MAKLPDRTASDFRCSASNLAKTLSIWCMSRVVVESLPPDGFEAVSADKASWRIQHHNVAFKRKASIYWGIRKAKARG